MQETKSDAAGWICRKIVINCCYNWIWVSEVGIVLSVGICHHFGISRVREISGVSNGWYVRPDATDLHGLLRR